MSTPPPPPPGPPGGFQPPPSYQPPAGYQPYPAGPPVQSTNSGMAIAGMVLSLVGLIPCFWFFQIPGVLGAIFGFIGLGQTKDGKQRGRGMAIAGVVIGIILVVGCAAFWIWISTNDRCYRDGNSFRCYSN